MEILFLAILVLIMATALGSGYPVAFALPGAAIITIGLAAGSGLLFAGSTDAYFHSGGPQQWLSAGVTNLRGVYWEVERDTLIAIPLFIFMGIMLQRSKIAEDLLVTMAHLFGPVPGGLGISVVFVGALLAATTGIVGATVVAMGLISLPAMLRNNYSPSLATGTIAASGTLGQIIPPSIVLIILADQLASATDQASTARKALYKEATGELSMPSVFDVASTSAGEMFLGAFIPGLVLVGLYMLYILVFAIIRPSSAPAVKYAGKFNGAFWANVALTLIPPLALIFLVLGSIIAGIATVNQAGAIGAAGAMIMAGYRLAAGRKTTYVPAIIALVSLGVIAFCLSTYEMNIKGMQTSEDRLGVMIGLAASFTLIVSLVWSGWRTLKIDNTLHGVMLETAKTTSLVFIILLGAAMLTAAFRAFGGEELVREFLNSLPGGFWTQFIIVMAVIFVLGFFLDFIEIAVVVVPIVAPILLADPEANITAVWLGVMIGLNIQTSFLTPPFGFALFYLRGVAPAAVKTMQMYKGVIAFICLQLLALGIVGFYPPLVNYLPNRVSYLSDTSPPPRNPKLQYCMEEYVANLLANGDGAVVQTLKTAQGLDLSMLPKKMGSAVKKGIDGGEEALASLQAAFVAETAVEAAQAEYRPKLRLVRGIEKKIRHEQELLDTAKTMLGRVQGDNAAATSRLEGEIAAAQSAIESLKAQIPADWEETHTTFAKLTKAEDDARNTYRRKADASYEAAFATLEAMNGTEAFIALEQELRDLRTTIETGAPEETHELVNDMSRKFSDIEATDDVKSALSKARRKLKSKSPDVPGALEEYDKAIKAYEAGKVWRAKAETDLRAGLTTYLDGIRTTLGTRVQPKLDREQALYLASCSAYHRDISLNF
nr:TRAP transporter large permease subunit [Amylibacter sp.]